VIGYSPSKEQRDGIRDSLLLETAVFCSSFFASEESDKGGYVQFDCRSGAIALLCSAVAATIPAAVAGESLPLFAAVAGESLPLIGFAAAVSLLLQSALTDQTPQFHC